jgi:nucleotide-binding universal stress UspA family protein
MDMEVTQMRKLRLAESWHRAFSRKERVSAAAATAGELTMPTDREESSQVRLKHIVAWPGTSPIAADVVQWGVRLSRFDRSSLLLLGIEPVAAMPTMTDAAIGSASLARAEARTGADLKLESVVLSAKERDGLKEDDWPRVENVDILTGASFSALLDEIREFSTNLVILPSYVLADGEGDVQHVLRECLRRTDLNLLFVQPSASPEIRTITVLVDFSSASLAAARQARSFAGTSGAALRFLYPYHIPVMNLDYLGVGAGPESYDEMMHQRMAEGRLKEWLTTTAGLDIGEVALVCRQVPNWDYEDNIVSAIAQEQPDLLVLPLRHRPWTRIAHDARLLRQIVDRSKSSLLVVRSR